MINQFYTHVQASPSMCTMVQSLARRRKFCEKIILWYMKDYTLICMLTEILFLYEVAQSNNGDTGKIELQ